MTNKKYCVRVEEVYSVPHYVLADNEEDAKALVLNYNKETASKGSYLGTGELEYIGMARSAVEISLEEEWED